MYVKEVKSTCYQTSDGKLYLTVYEAIEHEKQLNFEHELTYLVQDNCEKIHEDYVYKFILEHMQELLHVFSKLSPSTEVLVVRGEE